MFKTKKAIIPATVVAFTAALALSACDEQGPAEQIGESIDESAEEIGDAVKDATN